MKKRLKFMFVMILILPFIVNAEQSNDELVTVAKTTKYFKTVSIYNNSSIMREANLGEMSTLTTEITKEEFDNADATTEPVAPLSGSFDSQTETTYKRLTTTIDEDGQYYRYTTNLYWKNMPKVRSYDIIAIGHYNDVEPYNSSYIIFNQEYCENQYLCYSESTGTDVVKEYGTAEVFHLPDESIISMEQTLSFTVKKRANYTVDYQVAAGDYAHATKAITSAFAAQNFGLGVGGLVIYNAIYDYYDTTPAAIASWEGTW